MDNQQGKPTRDPDLRLEAARYALLRRLAHDLRHPMVAHLQPIGLISEVMERRLHQDVPDPVALRENVARIRELSRAAVQSCLEVASWLAAEEDVGIALGAGVDECVSLLQGSLGFQGFRLNNTTAGELFPVARTGLRHVLPACLLAITDRVASPCEVLLSAQTDAERATLTLRVQAMQAAAGSPQQAPYRVLQWHEVELLAQAEGFELTHTDEWVYVQMPAANARSA